MPKKRRHRTQESPEQEILSKGRWSGYNRQQELIRQNHTQSENHAAERRCQQFLSGGIDAIDWSELIGDK